jgi:ABC-2 type transport system permease protein
VRGYAGSLFTLLAVPVGVFTAARLGEFAADETGRRSTLLFAQPLSRPRAVAAEATAAAGRAVLLASVAAVAAWAGTAT